MMERLRGLFGSRSTGGAEEPSDQYSPVVSPTVPKGASFVKGVSQYSPMIHGCPGHGQYLGD
jgi:uroporphyrinogen-III decarboxylase